MLAITIGSSFIGFSPAHTLQSNWAIWELSNASIALEWEAMTISFKTTEVSAIVSGVKAAAVLSAVRPRVDSIDLLRGVVMLLMALDHTRDFFGPSGMNVRKVEEPALFLTRWVTHFCAPLFIFLAGASAYLYGTRGRTLDEVSRFLLTRGLWLIALEFTIVRLGWTFSIGFDFLVARVIWAIGAAMVALAGLVYLPRWAIAATALVMIGGHNLLDFIRAEHWGAAAPLWTTLHQRGLC